MKPNKPESGGQTGLAPASGGDAQGGSLMTSKVASVPAGTSLRWKRSLNRQVPG
jgi:hypothetical protein